MYEAEKAIEVAEKILSKPLEEFLGDYEAVFALRYAVIQFVEAAAQIGLVLLRRYGEAPSSYSEIFTLLAERGLMPRDLAAQMRRFAGLRNILVHRYWEVDDERMYRELRDGIESARRFINWARSLRD